MQVVSLKWDFYPIAVMELFISASVNAWYEQAHKWSTQIQRIGEMPVQ